MNQAFWSGRRVFITGHTGFKGSWLSAWLQRAKAIVTGYALPPTTPSLFEAARIGEGMQSVTGDVRDAAALRDALLGSEAEIVFHLAAQPLVGQSYLRPSETYVTNVIGTAHLLDAAREAATVRAIVVVTSDKCYDNDDCVRAHRESDPLGGRDPYSSSKACAELVVAAYRASFFSDPNSPAIGTVRAGNVIGGGDWSQDRLVPDLIRAFSAGRTARIRNPDSVRPWQHVLDPLHGYLLLAETLFVDRNAARAWNFGPSDHGTQPVRSVADAMMRLWGNGASWEREEAHAYEARTLSLDSALARRLLGWEPRLDLEAALQWTVESYRHGILRPDRVRESTLDQIRRYEELGV